MPIVQIIVVVIMIALLVFIGMVSKNRSGYDWQSLTKISDLQFEWNHETGWNRTLAQTGHLTGVFKGRRIDIQERLLARAWTTTYGVSYVNSSEIDLQLYPGIKVFGKQVALNKSTIIQVGDPQFDERFVIRANSPELVRLLLGKDAKLRDQLVARRTQELRITSGQITYEHSGRMRDALRVETILEMLSNLGESCERLNI